MKGNCRCGLMNIKLFHLEEDTYVCQYCLREANWRDAMCDKIEQEEFHGTRHIQKDDSED